MGHREQITMGKVSYSGWSTPTLDAGWSVSRPCVFCSNEIQKALSFTLNDYMEAYEQSFDS